MATLMTPTAPGPRRKTPERTVRTVSPRVDIYETEKTYVLLADMPGVAPGGLDVETERDILIIRRRDTRPETPPDYLAFELADYLRTFVLTEDLDPECVTAAMRDGIVRRELPKSR